MEKEKKNLAAELQANLGKQIEYLNHAAMNTKGTELPPKRRLPKFMKDLRAANTELYIQLGKMLKLEPNDFRAFKLHTSLKSDQTKDSFDFLIQWETTGKDTVIKFAIIANRIGRGDIINELQVHYDFDV